MSKLYWREMHISKGIMRNTLEADCGSNSTELIQTIFVEDVTAPTVSNPPNVYARDIRYPTKIDQEVQRTTR